MCHNESSSCGKGSSAPSDTTTRGGIQIPVYLLEGNPRKGYWSLWPFRGPSATPIGIEVDDGV